MSVASDYCVVITRPAAQAKHWAEALTAAGFQSTTLNLLEIVPVNNEDQVRAVKNKILDFDLYQKAIFVSQNAVEFGMQWIEDYWPQVPTGIDFFAVGTTTANKLADYGVLVTDLAVSANSGMTSEDLLRAPGLQQVEGEKIIIFRGCGGRGLMADELRKRGAWVDYCELYQRQLPARAETQLQALARQISAAEQQYLLSVHSGESLENLLQIVPRLMPASQTALLDLPLLVPGQRIAAQAKAAGFSRIVCALNATDVAMTQALVSYLSSQK